MNPSHVGRLSLDMAFETLKCSQCGAVPKDTRTKFCGFCGSLLPLQVPVPASPIEAPERFEAALAHPDLPRLLERVPLDRGAASIAPGVVLLVVMVVFGVLMLSQVSSGGRQGVPAGMLLIPGVMGLVAITRIVSAVN